MSVARGHWWEHTPWSRNGILHLPNDQSYQRCSHMRTPGYYLRWISAVQSAGQKHLLECLRTSSSAPPPLACAQTEMHSGTTACANGEEWGESPHRVGTHSMQLTSGTILRLIEQPVSTTSQEPFAILHSLKFTTRMSSKTAISGSTVGATGSPVGATVVLVELCSSITRCSRTDTVALRLSMSCIQVHRTHCALSCKVMFSSCASSTARVLFRLASYQGKGMSPGKASLQHCRSTAQCLREVDWWTTIIHTIRWMWTHQIINAVWWHIRHNS